MSLSIVLVRRDAEKLKFFNFAASLKKRVADDVEKKNAYHIWCAATGRQEKRDKCESTFTPCHTTFRPDNDCNCDVDRYNLIMKFMVVVI